MNVIALVTAGLLLLPPAALHSQDCAPGRSVAFVGVDVLTMQSEDFLRAQTVVVRDGRIASVGSAEPPSDACRVDGKGKTLLPGLADMHAHMTERDLPLFLANGVTLVREMNGSVEHLALRKRLSEGVVVGPRLLVASPLLVGEPLRYRHRLITSADDARAAAHEAKDAGYDYLKVYDGLTADQYEALVGAGRFLGLPLDGHIPAAAGLAAVLASGQSIQHMDKIAFALAGHSGDSTKLPEARRLFAASKPWVTPTLASLRALDQGGTAEYAARMQRPEVQRLDPATLGWWASLERGGGQSWSPTRFYGFMAALLRTLVDAGVPMLLGTDAGNPLMVAGYSVHEELEALVSDGGMTPFQALTTATVNAAEFIGDPTGGRIVSGARADLVLVDGNPLRNLTTLRNPLGVMVGGRWLEAVELRRMVEGR
jgi:imidazolonepropionase-like amidohydrolase